MKKDLGIQPAVFPMPVLMVAAYDENGTVNVMNAAWGTVCSMDKVLLVLDEAHKTTKNILKTKAFTVALADRTHVAEADYLGTVSGNDVPDKFSKTGLHASKSAFVNAPVVEEFPLTMECELLEVAETGALWAVIGKIVNVCADEAVLDEKGAVDVKKLDAVMFDQFGAGYYTVGEKVGQAWNAGSSIAE